MGHMAREKTCGHRLDLLEGQVKLSLLGANKEDELAVLLDDMIAIAENGSAKVCHGSGGIVLLRAE